MSENAISGIESQVPKPTSNVRLQAPKNKERKPQTGSRSVDAQLTRLESENLIRLLRDEIDPAYIFKHTLTQETAYDAMLKTKRAELHRQVAEAIEKLSPDQLEQNAAVLALHYERGGWDDLAFVYAALAGDVAWRAYAHREALMQYDNAIAIANRVDAALFAPRVREVFAKRGRVFEVIENRAAAIENYNAMIAFAQRAGDAAMEAEALNHLVTVQSLMMGAVPPQIDALLERALTLARQIDNRQLIGRTYWNMGLSRRFSDPARASEYFKQSLELARAANLKELAAYSFTELTLQGQITGQWRAAQDYARQALEEFRALDNKPMVGDSLANYAEIKYLRGEPEEARQSAEEGARISSAIENPWGTLFNRTILLTLDGEAGEFDSVLVRGQEHLNEARRIGFPPFVGIILQNLIRVHLESNQLDIADKLADECVHALEQTQAQLWMRVAAGAKGLVLVRRGMLESASALLDPLWRQGEESQTSLFSFMWAGAAIGELALTQGRLDFGLSFCDWLIGRLEPEQAGRVIAEVLYWRGRIHLARGHEQSAESDLSRAHELLERANYKLLLWRADAELAKVYMRRNESERARQARQRAADEIRVLATKISDSKLRDSFLGQKDVAELLSQI